MDRPEAFRAEFEAAPIALARVANPPSPQRHDYTERLYARLGFQVVSEVVALSRGGLS